MTLRGCPREKEVHLLVARGQWPQASSVELCEHVRACRVCGDLALVATTFQQARAQTIAAAPKSGSPGALWWRAQLRRRRAAVQRIERPLLGAQIFALAVGLLTALGFAGFEARHGIAWLDWLEGLPYSATLQFADLSSSGLLASGWGWLLLAAAVTLVLFGGIAVALSGKN